MIPLWACHIIESKYMPEGFFALDNGKDITVFTPTGMAFTVPKPIFKMPEMNFDY